jgi:hypothetical protein
MFQRSYIGAVLLFAATMLAGGCSAQSRGEKMVQSFSKTRDMLVRAQSQVDMTLLTLNGLRANRGDLGGAFTRYKDSVAQLEKEGTNARRRAEAMKEESDAHIQAWQSEMESIKDPTIKANLQSRREAVRTNFNLVQMYAQDARKAYDPFLRGNKEIVQALSIDLSPAAISGLAPSMDRITAQGKALKEKIAAMQHAMDNMANGVSPLGEMR